MLLAQIFSSLKAAFLCFISSGFVTAFKLLYKESTVTVDRPLLQSKVMTMASVSTPQTLPRLFRDNNQGKSPF